MIFDKKKFIGNENFFKLSVSTVSIFGIGGVEYFLYFRLTSACRE